MLKQGFFINRKFNKLLVVNIWGWISYCINMMTDTLISGNRLGEVPLQAVSIVLPLFSVAYFFAYLVAPGASILYGKHIGEFDKEGAYKTAGLSVITSAVIGLLISGVLFLIKEPFLAYYHCTGELYEHASAYYTWTAIYALIYPVILSIYYLTMTDGEALFVSIGTVLDISSNVFLSIVLSGLLGTAGLGMSTCIGSTLYGLTMCLHFLKKNNSIRFRPYLNLRVILRSVYLSTSRFSSYLCMALVDLLINKLIIVTSGVIYIAAYSVINLIFGIYEMYGAIYDSCAGFMTSYLGERNDRGIRNMIRTVIRSGAIMGTILWALFFFGAPLMPKIYGMETAEVIEAAITASRYMAFGAFGFGFNYIVAELSTTLEKPLQATILSFLNDLFSPLLLSIPFAFLWGFQGITAGMALSSYLTILIFSTVMILKNGRKGYPLYLEDFGEEVLSYDLRVNAESIAEVRDRIGQELIAHGYHIRNAELLLEELFVRIMEKNPKKEILAEVSVLFHPEHVRIIVRDDGVIFDYTDENNALESLNAHVLNSILERTENKNYLLTTSFNRNGFQFERE